MGRAPRGGEEEQVEEEEERRGGRGRKDGAGAAAALAPAGRHVARGGEGEFFPGVLPIWRPINHQRKEKKIVHKLSYTCMI